MSRDVELPRHDPEKSCCGFQPLPSPQLFARVVSLTPVSASGGNIHFLPDQPSESQPLSCQAGAPRSCYPEEAFMGIQGEKVGPGPGAVGLLQSHWAMGEL